LHVKFSVEDDATLPITTKRDRVAETPGSRGGRWGGWRWMTAGLAVAGLVGGGYATYLDGRCNGEPPAGMACRDLYATQPYGYLGLGAGAVFAGITITEAGTAHTTLVREDYAPQPVVNFDVNLHGKRAVEDNRLLNRNAGYSFRRGSETVSVLGPKALEPRRLEETQMFAQHELYVGSATNINRDDATVELESWTRNFTGYFHRYIHLPLSDRPGWRRIVEYYDGASADAQHAALQQLVAYYNTPPADTDAERVRREIRRWMGRLTSRNEGGTLVPALNAALPAAP
jgi:hypothetical protein